MPNSANSFFKYYVMDGQTKHRFVLIESAQDYAAKRRLILKTYKLCMEKNGGMRIFKKPITTRSERAHLKEMARICMKGILEGRIRIRKDNPDSCISDMIRELNRERISKVSEIAARRKCKNQKRI